MSNNPNNSGKNDRVEDWAARLDQAAASDTDIQRVHDDLARDKERPSGGFPVVPIFLIFFMSGLILFGAIYAVHYSDDFDSLGYDETRRRFAWADTGAAEGPSPFVIGERLYQANCAMCHQQNGEGLAGVFPPLNQTDWVTGSETRLIKILLNGMVGPVEVRGNTYNGVMPAFGNWSNDQIAAVTTYIRQAWDNDAGDITPEMVSETRALVGGRTNPFTAEEL